MERKLYVLRSNMFLVRAVGLVRYGHLQSSRIKQRLKKICRQMSHILITTMLRDLFTCSWYCAKPKYRFFNNDLLVFLRHIHSRSNSHSSTRRVNRKAWRRLPTACIWNTLEARRSHSESSSDRRHPIP